MPGSKLILQQCGIPAPDIGLAIVPTGIDAVAFQPTNDDLIVTGGPAA
ncbi:hypothetical protein [Nocardia sp. NPDC057455]